MSNIERYSYNMPRVTDEVPEHITKEEYEEMRSWILTHGRNGQRNHLVLHLLWFTGGRVSDVAALKVKDFNFAKRTVTLTIKKSARKPSKKFPKGRKARKNELPLLGDLGMEVMSYIKARNLDEDDYIVQGRDKKKPLTRQQIYNITENAGMGAIGRWVHPHMFRHGTAMQLLNSGRNTYEIQAWMAHSSPQVTFNTYARVTTEMKRKAAEESGIE